MTQSPHRIRTQSHFLLPLFIRTRTHRHVPREVCMRVARLGTGEDERTAAPAAEGLARCLSISPGTATVADPSPGSARAIAAHAKALRPPPCLRAAAGRHHHLFPLPGDLLACLPALSPAVLPWWPPGPEASHQPSLQNQCARPDLLQCQPGSTCCGYDDG